MLLHRGKARRIHEVVVDVIDERAILLRLGFDLLPFRISLEFGPILFRFLATGMLENVDEQILRARRIFRYPIPNAVHVMPLEDRVRVIPKSCLQGLGFALVHVIHPQFVNVMRGIGSD